MSLLRQIQQVLERTYAPVGVNLEDCLIGQRRCLELSTLAGSVAEELSEEGRTFFRIRRGRLHVGIYYHPAVIETLERNPPTTVISHENIRSLIVFCEEVDHAIHGGLKFSEDPEIFEDKSTPDDLELQGKIDTYQMLQLLASRVRGAPLKEEQRKWFREMLFCHEVFDYRGFVLRHRYEEANRLGYRLAAHLDRLEKNSRLRYLRYFRGLSFEDKKTEVESLVLVD